jgi:preprotein translocase subunit SecG
MSTLLTVLHILVCLFLMLTVLLQSGKGGGMGAAFGGGNAATVFGGSGASSFLRRLTAVAGTIFMLTSMLLAFLASHNAADALERFGEQQEKLAAEKESARKKALDTPGPGSAGSGSASGSASTMVPLTPIDQSGQSHDPNGATKPDEKPNPATPATMSPPAAGDQKPGTAAPPTGTPAEAPPAAGSPAKAPDAKTPDAKPATQPADGKPADAKPAGAQPAAAKPATAKPATAKPATAKPNDRSDRAP